jgi:CO dehydrogenase nickel-insertion accessory protein CooC1
VAAERIAGLRHELEINIEHAYLILNRLNGEMPAPLQDRIEALEVPFLGIVPADSQLATFEFSGHPLIDLGDQSPVYQAVAEMMERIL